MIILEKPYTSDVMASYLEESRTPVLANAEATLANRHGAFNLLSDAAFADAVNAGARLYTTSEHALEWVTRHVHRESYLQAAGCMKDKAKLRRALAPLYPGYFFREADVTELSHIRPEDLPLPLILKPVVGFFSVGVYVIATPSDWVEAVVDIQRKRSQWRRDYPGNVVGDTRFILEEYIDGEEYAIDAYYDGEGRAVIVNILRHEFASREDVSDRLYYTSPEIIRENLEPFTKYLDSVGKLLKIRDFPLHLEVRVGGKGIAPIEFNPCRFAGWCTTDLSWFAYGFRTYDYYLANRRPDWNTILEGREGNLYSLVILEKPDGAVENSTLDYDMVAASFTEVLNLRKIETPGSPVFAFVFARTPAANRAELDNIKAADLRGFMV